MSARATLARATCFAVIILVNHACSSDPPVAQSWRYSATVANQEQLADRLAAIDLYESTLRVQGLREAGESTGSSVDSLGMRRTRQETVYRGELPPLPEVEVTITKLDYYTPDQPAIEIRIAAMVPPTDEANEAWSVLRAAAEEALRPGN